MSQLPPGFENVPLESKNLFQLGDFTLASGAKSSWKLECDALTDADWAALAVMVHQIVGPFSRVYGVPRGGLKLSAALAPLATAGAYLPLVVDDVFTTGGSLDRFIASQQLEPCMRCVVFARGWLPWGTHAVLQMPKELWLKRQKLGPSG